MSSIIKFTVNARTVQKGVRLFNDAVTKRTYCVHAAKVQSADNQQSRFGSGIVTSPLGPCKKIPSENLVEYVWKKSDSWIDKPAAVSHNFINIYIHITYLPILKYYIDVFSVRVENSSYSYYYSK